MVMHESTHSISSTCLRNVFITAGSVGLLCKLIPSLQSLKALLAAWQANTASQPLQEVWNSYLGYRKWYETGEACIREHEHVSDQLLDQIQQELHQTLTLLEEKAIFLSQSVYDSFQAYLHLHTLWMDGLLWENETYVSLCEQMEEIRQEEQSLLAKLRQG